MSSYEAQLTTFMSQFKGIFFDKNHSLVSSEQACSKILHVVLANPTWTCLEALSVSILGLSKKHPRHVDTFVLAITKLLDTKEARLLTIKEEDGDGADEESADDGNRSTLRYVFTLHLAEFLKDALHETALHARNHNEVESSNPCLAAALFSACAIKHGLLEYNKSSYAFTRQGLQLPDSDQERGTEQVVAIGACLHLSIAGSIMMKRWLEKSDGHEAVLTALRLLKKNKVIHSVGVSLLENTIANAKTRFSRDSIPTDAWISLFPQT